jgi:hypothetical protein
VYAAHSLQVLIAVDGVPAVLVIAHADLITHVLNLSARDTAPTQRHGSQQGCSYMRMSLDGSLPVLPPPAAVLFYLDPCAEAELALLDLGAIILADFILTTSPVVVG